MAIPNWNVVEIPTEATSNLEQASEVTYRMDQSVRVNTVHHGRASYSERGRTNFSIPDIIEYGLENHFIERESYENGMLPTLELLKEIAEDMFQTDCDGVDDMYDIDYDDWEESDYEFDNHTLVS